MNLFLWFKRNMEMQNTFFKPYSDKSEMIHHMAITLLDMAEPTLIGTGSREISWEKGNLEIIIRNRRRKPYAKPAPEFIAPGDPRFIGPLTPKQEALLQANLDKAEKQEP